MVSTIIIKIKGLPGAGHLISNLVFVARCPLCIYAEKTIGEQATEEETASAGAFIEPLQ